MTDSDDDKTLTRMGGLLHKQREQIDAATLSRLNRARHSALDELQSCSLRHRVAWFPAGVAAAFILVVAGTAFNVLRLDPAVQSVRIEPVSRKPDVPNLDLIFADEGLDMLEDLDFYLWVEAEEISRDLSVDSNWAS